MFGFFRSRSRAPRERFHGFFIGSRDDHPLSLPFTPEQVSSMTYIMDNCAFAYLEHEDYYRRYRKLWQGDLPRVWSAWDDASLCLIQHPQIDATGGVASGAELGVHVLSVRQQEIAYAWVGSRHFPADTGLPEPLRRLLAVARWQVHGEPLAGEQPLGPELHQTHQANTDWLTSLHDRLDDEVGLGSAGPRPLS